MENQNKRERAKADFVKSVQGDNQFYKFQTTANSIDSKSQYNFFNRRLYNDRCDAEMENAITQAKNTAESREFQIKMEERLAAELVEAKRNKICEEKRRQHLRETNQDLKDLEVKLRSAYVAKTIKAQLAEKESKKREEKIIKNKEYELMLAARLKDEEYYREERLMHMQRQLEQRNALQDQIITAHQRNQCLYEEFLREKKYLDEIVNRIQNEQLEDMQNTINKREQLKADIEIFKKSQKLWLHKQEEEIEQENRRIFEYVQKREQKLKDDLIKQKEKQSSKTEMSNKMVKELFEMQEKVRKREELLIALKVEELNEKEELKIRDEMERRFRERIAMRLTLERQKADRITRAQKEKEEDILFYKDQMQKLAEKDRIDELNKDARRRKIENHKIEVARTLEMKRIRRAEEIAENIRLNQLDFAEEKRQQELVEEERIKMLQEHAEALVGFFPPGVLRESDRQYLSLPPTTPTS